jgi:hypothetical protein
MVRVGLIPVLAVLLLCPVAGRAASLFDPPVAVQQIPPKSDDDALGELTCFWYRDFMVLAAGTDSPAPRPARIVAGARPACNAKPTAREITLDTENFSFIGRKGPFLFFGETDANGAVAFKIIDTRSGGIIYTDGFLAIPEPFRSVRIENGGLHIRYTRGLNAPCSIVKGATGCWSQLVTEGKIPPEMAQTVPSPQVCAVSYKDTPADDPSIIIYDVEVTIDEAGKARMLSHGPVKCDAMP